MFAIILSIAIIAAAMGLTIGFMMNDCWEFWETIPFTIMIGIIAIVVTGLCIGVPGSAVAQNSDNLTVYESTTQEILAAKDNITAEGRGSYYHVGYVKEELYYFYLYETDKGIAQGKIPAEHTFIVQKDVAAATLQTNYREVENGFYKGWNGPNEYILILPLDAEIIDETYIIDLE
jgi:hypothetical protein